MDYTLSKDAETGTVTIIYSSPVELPFKFEWTASVDVFGNVTSTPMKFENPVARLDAKTAGAMVDESAKNLRVNLNDAQKREAVRLLVTHGTDMLAKNAGIFAKFAVRLAGSNVPGARRDAMASSVAARVRSWRDFGFGTTGMSAFNAVAKTHVNSTIGDYMRPEKNNEFVDSIFKTMTADANRGVYILNGTAYEYKSADELIPAFKTLVPDPKKQKALSSWLNQLSVETFMAPAMRCPYSSGQSAVDVEGFGMFANLDTAALGYPPLSTVGHGITHNLQISPDGKTATITQSMSADLAAPGSSGNNVIDFGQVTFTQRLVIDLTPEIPTVVDYQISQTIA